jgi:hypothetical protein
MNQRDRYLLNSVQTSTWLANYKRQNQNLVDIEPYTYTGTIQNVAAGATGSVSIPIQADSDFVAIETTGAIIDNTLDILISNPLLTVQVTDTGTGKTFFSDYTLFPMVFGIAGFPYYMPTPRIISPNTNLLVNVTSLATDPYTIYVAFQGARLYYASSS